MPKFEPGNKMGRGRPPGSRNKKSLFAEEFQKDGVNAIRKCKLLALDGHLRALEIWIAHLEAPCKPPHNRFRLPSIKTGADLVNVLPTVMRAVASGKMSAQDGDAMAHIVQSQQKVIESVEFDQRLRCLEERTSGAVQQSDGAAEERRDSLPEVGEQAVSGEHPAADSSSSTAAGSQQATSQRPSNANDTTQDDDAYELKP
jgi:hypothetical protein